MEKHHSCINTRAIIEYFQGQSPEAVPTFLAGLGPEIAALPAPREFLLEANNWVSSEVVIQMFHNARRITGREDIAFDIGFQSAARKKLGYVLRLFPGWGGPTGHGGGARGFIQKPYRLSVLSHKVAEILGTS